MNSRKCIFLKVELPAIEAIPELISMSQVINCDSQGTSAINIIQQDPSWIDATPISRTEYIIKCFHDSFDHILQNVFYALEINGKTSTSATWHLINSRAHERYTCVTSSDREGISDFNKGQIIKEATPLKKNTNLFKRRNTIVASNLQYSLERPACSINSAYEHTAWSMLSPVSRWRSSGAIRLTRFVLRKK